MDNLNDKLSNEAQSQPSCLGAVSGSALSCFDLKIGNYFFCEKMRTIAKVKTFNTHGIRAVYSWGGELFINLKEAKSLLISEEILKKFGFYEDVIDSQESIFGFSIHTKFCYKNYTEDFTIQKHCDGYYFVDSIDINLFYIHELQNIYHSLTGTMLSLS